MDVPALMRTGQYQLDGTFTDWQSRFDRHSPAPGELAEVGVGDSGPENSSSLAVGKLPTSAGPLSKLPTVRWKKGDTGRDRSI